MLKYKTLYEIAVQIGEQHSRQVVEKSREVQILRRVIWRALIQLRSGRADLARYTLEQQVKKDQQ